MSLQRERPAGRPGWPRMASSGLDLVIVIAGFTAIGWWLDRRYGWYPWGTLVSAVLGVVGGMTNFLREALKSSRLERSRRDDGGGHGS